MFSHILTVEENLGDSVRWIETGFSLSSDLFPILRNARPGDQFKLFYNADDGWLGRSVKSIERYEAAKND